MGRARAGEGEAPTETSGRARGVLVAADVEEEDGVVQVEPPLAEEVEGEERHVVEAHGDDGPVLRRPRRGEVEAQVKEVEGRGQPRPPPAGARGGHGVCMCAPPPAPSGECDRWSPPGAPPPQIC